MADPERRGHCARVVATAKQVGATRRGLRPAVRRQLLGIGVPASERRRDAYRSGGLCFAFR